MIDKEQLAYYTLIIHNLHLVFIVLKISLVRQILGEVFIRKGSKPKCLGLVLEILQKENKILTKQDYLKKQQEQVQGWVSFAFNKLIWSPLTWTTKYIVNTAASNSTSSSSNTGNKWVVLNNSTSESDQTSVNQINYVLIESIDKKAIEIHEYLISKLTYPELDCLIDYEHFHRVCFEEFNIKDNDDLELILANLLGKRRIITNDTLVKDKKLLKFSPISTGNANLKISELEVSFYVLKLSESKIEKQLSYLNSDVEKINKEIKIIITFETKISTTSVKVVKKA